MYRCEDVIVAIDPCGEFEVFKFLHTRTAEIPKTKKVPWSSKAVSDSNMKWKES